MESQAFYLIELYYLYSSIEQWTLFDTELTLWDKSLPSKSDIVWDARDFGSTQVFWYIIFELSFEFLFYAISSIDIEYLTRFFVCKKILISTKM